MIEDNVGSLFADGMAAIEGAKSRGQKVVGYFPGPYVPEELIYASGALPVCLAYGGEAQTADYALSLLPPVICPFARAQVGEMLLKDHPAYRSLDLLVVPSTCQHLRKTGDLWEYYEPADVFKLGVPYDPSESLALDYYRERLGDLKARLEGLTGRDIAAEDVTGAIAVYDRLRRALRDVSLMRLSAPPAISGLQFMKLNHASLYGDPVSVALALEAVHGESAALATVPATAPAAPAGAPAGAATPAPALSPAAAPSGAPRLLLIGPNVAIGDYGIYEMVETAGASIVIEDVFEGVRDYWHTVGEDAGVSGGAGSGSVASGGLGSGSGAVDPLDALVRARFDGRVPAAFMRSSTGPRLEHIRRLIQDFQVQGVIWYELLCCEFYDQDAYLFEDRLRRMGIPMLVIESNYDDVRSGSVRTRLEAFLEMVQGGLVDA